MENFKNKLGNTELHSIRKISFGTVSCFEEKVSLIRWGAAPQTKLPTVCRKSDLE